MQIIFDDNPNNDKLYFFYKDAVGGYVPLGDIQFQHGPVKENGKNGVDMLTAIMAITYRLQRLNKEHHDIENDYAIESLKSAQYYLSQRYKKRVKRGTEGTDND